MKTLRERFEDKLKVALRQNDPILLWEETILSFIEESVTLATREIKREIAEIKKELNEKEGEDVDKWSETGKVVYYYIDRLLSTLDTSEEKQ